MSYLNFVNKETCFLALKSICFFNNLNQCTRRYTILLIDKLYIQRNEFIYLYNKIYKNKYCRYSMVPIYSSGTDVPKIYEYGYYIIIKIRKKR